ncbi:hypothetical protein Emag_003902 [Eimeria magna]
MAPSPAGRQPPPPPVILRLARGARSGQGLSETAEPPSYERGFSPPQQGERTIRHYSRHCRNHKRAHDQRGPSSGEGSKCPPQPPLFQRQPQTRFRPSTFSEREAFDPPPPLRPSKVPSAEGRHPFAENSHLAYPIAVAPRGPLRCVCNPFLPYRSQESARSNWREGNIRSRFAHYEGSWGESPPLTREVTADRVSNHPSTTVCKRPSSPPPRPSVHMPAKTSSAGLVFSQSRRGSGETLTSAASHKTINLLRSKTSQIAPSEQLDEGLPSLNLESWPRLSQSPSRDDPRHLIRGSSAVAVIIESADEDLSVDNESTGGSGSVNSSSKSNNSSSKSNNSSSNCRSTRGIAGSSSRSGSERGNTDTSSGLGSPCAQRHSRLRGTRLPPPPPPGGHDAQQTALLVHAKRTAPVANMFGARVDPAESVASSFPCQPPQARHVKPLPFDSSRTQGTQHPAVAAAVAWCGVAPSTSSCHSHSSNASSSSRTNSTWLEKTAGVNRSSNNNSSSSGNSSAVMKREEETILRSQPHHAAPPAASAGAKVPFNRQTQHQHGIQQQGDALQHKQENSSLEPLRELQRQLKEFKCRTQQYQNAAELSSQQQELSVGELQQEQLRQHEVPHEQQAQQQHQLPLQKGIPGEALKEALHGSHRERAQANRQAEQQNLLLPYLKQEPQASLHQQHQLNQQSEHRPQAQQEPLLTLVRCKHDGTQVAATATATAANVGTNSCSFEAQQEAVPIAAGVAGGSSEATLRQPLPVQQEPRHLEQSSSLQEQEAHQTRMQQQQRLLSNSVTEQKKEHQRERQHQQQRHRQRQQQKQEQSDQQQQQTPQQPENLQQRRSSPPLQEEQQQVQLEMHNRKRRLANQQKPQHEILEPARQMQQTQQKQSGFSSCEQDFTEGPALEATRNQRQPLQETPQRQQRQQQLWGQQHTTSELTRHPSLPQAAQHLQPDGLQGLLPPQGPARFHDSRALRTIETPTPCGGRGVAAANNAAATGSQDLHGCCNHLFLPAASDFGLFAADAFYQYEADPPVAGGAAHGVAAATTNASGRPAAAAFGAPAGLSIVTSEEQEQQPATTQLTDVEQGQQQRQRLRGSVPASLQHGRPVEGAFEDQSRAADTAAKAGLAASAKRSAAATPNAPAAAVASAGGALRAAGGAVGALGAADGDAPQTTASSGHGHQKIFDRRNRPWILSHTLAAPNHQQQPPIQHQESQQQLQLSKQCQPCQQHHLQDQQRRQQLHLIKEHHITRLLKQAQQYQADSLETLRLLVGDEERDARLRRVEARKQPRQHQRLLLLLQQKALRLQQERAEVIQEMQQQTDACQKELRMLSVQSYEERRDRRLYGLALSEAGEEHYKTSENRDVDRDIRQTKHEKLCRHADTQGLEKLMKEPERHTHHVKRLWFKGLTL